MILYVMKPYMVEGAFTLMDAVLWSAFRQPAVMRDSIYGPDGNFLAWGNLSKYSFQDLTFGRNLSRHPPMPKCPSPNNYYSISKTYIVDEKVRSVAGDEVIERVMRPYPQLCDDAVYSSDDLNGYYADLDAYYKQCDQMIEKAKINILKMLSDGEIPSYGIRNSRMRMKYKKIQGFPDLYEGDVMSPDFHQNNSSVEITDDNDFSANTFYAYDGEAVEISKDNWKMDLVDWEKSLLIGDGGYFDIIINVEDLFKKIPMRPTSKASAFFCEGIVYSNFDCETDPAPRSKRVGRPTKFNSDSVALFLERNKANIEGCSQESAAQFIIEGWEREYGQKMSIYTAVSFIKKYRAGALGK